MWKTHWTHLSLLRFTHSNGTTIGHALRCEKSLAARSLMSSHLIENERNKCDSQRFRVKLFELNSDFGLLEQRDTYCPYLLQRETVVEAGQLSVKYVSDFLDNFLVIFEFLS